MHDGAGVLAQGVGEQDADRGERAGQCGNEHARDLQGVREGAGVERASASEGNQREVAGIVAALDGDDANGLLHGGLNDAQDAGGELFDGGEGSLPLLHVLQHAGAVEGDGASHEAVGVEAAEGEVGVGDGGLGAAAEADGAGIGAGGFGAYAEETAGVEASDGAAAGAGGVDVEHGHADGDAGDDGLVADVGAGGVDEEDIGGGAAHVEADDLIEAGEACELVRSDHSAGGSGEHGSNRLRGGDARGDDAAGGLHDFEAAAGVVLRDVGCEGGDVGADFGRDVGVGDDGGGALVLAELGQDAMRDGEWEAETFERGGDLAFAVGIGEGEERARRRWRQRWRRRWC